ncbi:MAG: glycosyltransferase family 9 protein, partial [bacterium]|nr:glycosyltransferase family 9 protein [bacterium]
KKVYGYSNEFRDFLLDVVLSKKKVHFSKKCMMLVGYWDVDFKDMYFPLVEEYLSFYEELIGKNYIVIAPFSNAPARRWHLKRFIEVMLELDDFFVIVGSSSDAKEFEEYEKYISKKRYKNLIGKTNILQLGAIIKNSKLLITNESGVMHIAACFDTPCVVISGPSDRNLTGVFGSSVVILQANLKCVPCVKNYCYRIGRGFMECMNLITLKDVLNAIKKLI